LDLWLLPQLEFLEMKLLGLAFRLIVTVTRSVEMELEIMTGNEKDSGLKLSLGGFRVTVTVT
jgi:hypothetical protein